jgi:anti-sigma factor RsiW
MTTIEDRAEFDHLESLLPWYVTGRLAPGEVLRVEQGLAQMPELQRRYELVLEERSAAVAVNESLGAPSPRVIEKLFARLDSPAARVPRRRNVDPGNWLAGWFSAWRPRALAWTALAAVCVAMIEAGLLVLAYFGAAQKGTTYWTASVERETAEQNGAFLLVAFVPGATAAQILHFLEARNISIIDGPIAGGIFRIRVSDKALAPKDLSAVAASLRTESSIVRFAAPTT